MKVGYFLASEEHGPRELLRQAQLAERAGFDALWISDHYHPWTDEQGHSPFVWSVIGAISAVCELPVTTAVTCPTVRIHPAVIAQAAATAAAQTGDRFRLGIGTGEALNEHILGDPWPELDERLAMLEESVEVMRALWSGRNVSHRGRHYTVSNARIYTRGEQPPPVYVSAFGPKAAKVAARIGDGLITTKPDSELLAEFREAGGAGKPTQLGTKVCYGTDKAAAVRTAHRRWANSGLPGELGQVLPQPRHFEQASTLVTEEMTAKSVVCGPDPDEHIAPLREARRLGFDEVYVNQMGDEADGFFRFYADQVLPKVR
ncbi:MAG: TIGR03557 family F420-dependent LLM class oxidoreductase [Micromonosporaceae bacterium]